MRRWGATKRKSTRAGCRPHTTCSITRPLQRKLALVCLRTMLQLAAEAAARVTDGGPKRVAVMELYVHGHAPKKGRGVVREAGRNCEVYNRQERWGRRENK